MADSKQSPKDITGKANISFPCGNLEKMLKKMRESNTGETGNNACSSKMKQFSKSDEVSSGCKTFMQRMLAAKDEDIDCKTVIKELFSDILKDKSESDA